MNSVIEVLHLRRPPINYVSPAACEVILSGSGSAALSFLLLRPIRKLNPVTGAGVLGTAPGPFSLMWETAPGVICYNIYQLIAGELVLIAECVLPGEGGYPLPGDGDFVITPVTPDGEGPPSDPVTVDEEGGPPPDPGGGGGGGGEDPPDDGGPCGEEGDDTTCEYAAIGDQYRIKNYNAGLFDISSCGLSWTNCVNCEIFPDTNCVDPVSWTGTFPVKVNDGLLIDQEFEPNVPCGGCPWPPAHLLHGFCISATLSTSSAPNSTGCGWAIVISAPFVGAVWQGVKSKGEGPVGKYTRTGGCCPGPQCLEIEAY